MTRMIRILPTIIAIIAGVYIVVCILAYLMQRQLIYFPNRHIATTPAALGLQFEEITRESADGVKFIVWFIPAESAGLSVVYFHGNAENLSNPVGTYKLLHDLGVSVYAFEYRGYATCTGSPSEEGITLDLQTFGKYLAEQRPDDTVVAFGRSLGGAVAVKFATLARVDGLILESTFNRMSDVARSAFPYLPISLLLREKYQSEDVVKGFTGPVLCLHSPDDEVIPFRLGKKLFDSIKSEKTFIEISGSHNSSVEESEPILRTAYAQFFLRMRNRG